ncbi:MAG: four helix bundle protein [Omnitrophica WOR_2 bacterium GWF2_43_52]|nr:MAG: four helix bundle protein [Omnitrophica WOR_2 bacterium GWC2_44_8]OGX20407.1 MAG: four helix bundle protein [Omnitrophica WOR_2 bacterium GWF2_43_52]OGX57427.1 MAG: four helix bundle protein [Omnitrophica WOR_2 bacterium RIFOXYC2_FULL_43_9]HAH20677.1 four helix bundle protein [Candidatus Omnitrophota bacterium]HBG62994.1 four helix bundle protein [Candidatus Omnitrophota bacterium]
MKKEKIQDRTYDFALEIVKFVKSMPYNTATVSLARQLIRSGTSIGANIEEAQGASSKKDFVNKINIAKKEARETKYWLRLINDTELTKSSNLPNLLTEANEIINILTAIVKTSESRLANS